MKLFSFLAEEQLDQIFQSVKNIKKHYDISSKLKVLQADSR